MLHPGDIVVVPFPYAEGKGRKWRPAIVISSAAFHKKYELCWVMMITSAANPPWPGDIAIPLLPGAGLSTPSVIRPAKIAALQIDAARKIGKIPPELTKKLSAFVRQQTG